MLCTVIHIASIMQWMIYVAFAVAILQPLRTHALPSGAPTSVCSSLVPAGHSVGAANDAPGGYFVDTSLRDTNFAFNASTEYTITLYGRAAMFRGFVIQARDMADSSLIGAFSDLETGTTQLLNCNDPGSDSTVTHTNNNDKIGVTVTWTSPPSTGVVDIRYSVVRQFRVAYYANLNAADFPPPCGPPPAVTATPETFYPIVFGFPIGCTRTNCNYFVAMGPNPANDDYLDIHLEGNAQGWVAVGFSEDMRMNGTDVLGCRVVGGMVEVIDSWNPAPRPPLQGNMPDAMINDTCPLFTQFENGRIICRFSRLINTLDVDNDLDLDDSYFLIFGRRLEAQPPATPALASHLPGIPMSSEMMLNPTMDNFTNLSPTPPATTCPPQPDPNTVYDFTSGTPGSGHFFGARVNPVDSNYLDMRLEGNAEGWVAIGFSDTQSMEESDVLGCKRDATTGIVTILDTWNPGPQRSRSFNMLDENQNGLCQHDAQFVNGRIMCTFSRLIVAQSGRDFSLNESLFQLYGMSTTGGPSNAGLAFHEPNTPSISTGRIVATLEGSASVFPRLELLKVHGILMIISWPVLVVAAIFFAAWMKPALPNGEWFQFHRAFMIAGVILTWIGFILAFVAHAPNSGLIVFTPTNGVHFAFGIIILALQIANPIIALFRCKPTSSKRWIFNISHATLIGFGAELLALTNVGIGIALFEGRPYRILWVYIGFVVFLVTLQVVLFILFTIVALNTDDPKVRKSLAPSLLKYVLADPVEKTESIEMSSPGAAKAEKSDKPVRKDPSKDAPLRWVALGVFMIVTLILMFTIVILVATR